MSKKSKLLLTILLTISMMLSETACSSRTSGEIGEDSSVEEQIQDGGGQILTGDEEQRKEQPEDEKQNNISADSLEQSDKVEVEESKNSKQPNIASSEENEDIESSLFLETKKQIKTFAPVNDAILTMEISLPEQWNFDIDDPTAKDQPFYDENKIKMGGSYGIVGSIEDNGQLENLDNIIGLPSIESSEIIKIWECDFLLQTSNISSRNRENLIVYAYYFVVDDFIINVYFYNDNDLAENIILYENILNTINVFFN